MAPYIVAHGGTIGDAEQKMHTTICRERESGEHKVESRGREGENWKSYMRIFVYVDFGGLPSLPPYERKKCVGSVSSYVCFRDCVR